MDKYDWLLKKHNKALTVFREAKKNLEHVGTQIQLEADKSRKAIVDMKDAIAKEEAAIGFLAQQGATISAQADKINAILE